MNVSAINFPQWFPAPKILSEAETAQHLPSGEQFPQIIQQIRTSEGKEGALREYELCVSIAISSGRDLKPFCTHNCV